MLDLWQPDQTYNSIYDAAVINIVNMHVVELAPRQRNEANPSTPFLSLTEEQQHVPSECDSTKNTGPHALEAKLFIMLAMSFAV